jgi:20S proteasome subunit alpha 3
MEAISHAGAAVGILASDGIVLATERRASSKLLEASKSSEKMYKLDDHVACAVAGITADANSLVQYTRSAAQRHRFRYQEAMPVELLVRDVCDMKQGYTQYGGLRPFGVSFLYAGWDRQHGFQLYHSDPSGNYSGWLATAIGAKNQPAQSILKQEYHKCAKQEKKDDDKVEADDGNKVEGEGVPTLEQAFRLAVRVLRKTLDNTSLDSDKLEFATLTLDPSTGAPVFEEFSAKQIDDIIAQCEANNDDDDD